MTSSRQRAGRTAFLACTLLLWALCLAAALEVGQIAYATAARSVVDGFKNERVKALRAADEALIAATSEQAPQPPSGLKRELPPRTAFLTLNEVQRADFAAQRRELTMLCDPAGKVLAMYTSPDPPEVAALSRRVRAGMSIAGLFPEREGRDALYALRGGATALHEYSLSLEGFANPYACAFTVCPLPEPDGSTIRMMASLLDSKYEVALRRYRPNIYRSNRFDPLYPQFKTAEFWTNSRGFRDDESAVPKPPGVVRIVCLGGSTTVEGPRNDLTCPNLLEKRLRGHFGTDRIEVVNCGVDALDSYGITQQLDDYFALEPDLILDYIFINDELTVRTRTARSIAPHGISLRDWLGRSRFLYASFPSLFLPPREEVAAAIGEVTRPCQREILAAARKHGADVAVCSIAYPDFGRLPRRERWYYDNRYTNVSWGQTTPPMHARIVDTYNASAREFCRQEGLLYIPVQEELKGGMEYFADIAHLRLPGIERKADIIFEHLKEYVAAKLPR